MRIRQTTAAARRIIRQAWARLLTNVPPGCDRADLPRVAYRVGRSWERGPNAWEVRVAWSLDRAAPPYCLAYRRERGVVLILPVIRGRFALRVIR